MYTYIHLYLYPYIHLYIYLYIYLCCSGLGDRSDGCGCLKLLVYEALSY
jgi:hypothetical protein